MGMLAPISVFITGVVVGWGVAGMQILYYSLQWHKVKSIIVELL